MKDYSYTEKVAYWIILGLQVLQIYYFRGNIPWGATSHKKVLFLIGTSRQPKVSNDTVVIILFPQNNVLRLEIPMHYVLSMHVFKSLEQSLHDWFYLDRCKPMFCLDLVVQLSTLQKLNLNINWVLGFIHTIKPHQILMVKLSVYLNLIHQWLLPVIFLEGTLLRKGLYCVLLLVFIFYDEINWSKVTFPYFFYWSEQLMETPLVYFRLKDVSPLNQQVPLIREELQLVPEPLKFDTKRIWNFLLLLTRIFEHQLKDKVEVKCHLVSEYFIRLRLKYLLLWIKKWYTCQKF